MPLMTNGRTDGRTRLNLSPPVAPPPPRTFFFFSPRPHRELLKRPLFAVLNSFAVLIHSPNVCVLRPANIYEGVEGTEVPWKQM